MWERQGCKRLIVPNSQIGPGHGLSTCMDSWSYFQSAAAPQATDLRFFVLVKQDRNFVMFVQWKPHALRVIDLSSIFQWTRKILFPGDCHICSYHLARNLNEHAFDNRITTARFKKLRSCRGERMEKGENRTRGSAIHKNKRLTPKLRQTRPSTGTEHEKTLSLTTLRRATCIDGVVLLTVLMSDSEDDNTSVPISMIHRPQDL